MRTFSKLVLGAALAVVALLALAGTALAQDIEVPILVLEGPDTDVGASDADLDLANIVQTAAKGVTTVQEAPAIVTVLPGDEIRDRGFRNLEELVDTVPGWLRFGAVHSEFPFILTRGTVQGVLFLQNGVSMFDPTLNVPTLGRHQPLETIKRVEIVTGPGGVLWGANSFLGILNIITKDAEDVDGVEAQVGYGSGQGDLNALRGYVMTGVPRIFSDDIKLFAHASFERFEGAHFTMPYFMFHSPQPQPNSLFFYGAETETDPATSMLFMVDGKLSLGPVNLYWQYPFGERYHGLGFAGPVLLENLPEDQFPECQGEFDPEDPATNSPADRCVDKAKVGRVNRFKWFDRYLIGEYKTRFADNKAGLTVKGYFTEFVRIWDPLQFLIPVETLAEGGIGFRADVTNYRAGGSIDGDLELTEEVRLLYGVESFHEWTGDNTINSRQGAGVEATFPSPYDLGRLPLPCPRSATWDAANNQVDTSSIQFVRDCPLTFAFEADRTTFGAFANAQWRPTERLILDAGARYQFAPDALSKRPYNIEAPLTGGPLVGGALVYELIDDWHVKLNYTEGFRAPVFNNTDSNGEAVQLKGQRELVPETSQSMQTEVNARLLRGKRGIRELNLRADYSYTILREFITFTKGQYENTGTRGIHSAEFLGKLYLKGGHRLELAYTWLKTAVDDEGSFKAMPEHWFNLGGVIALSPDKLELASMVRIIGAFEDPNRRVDVRGLKPITAEGCDEMPPAPSCNPSPTTTDPSEVRRVDPFEIVMDRIPPSAELQLGLRWWATRNILVSAFAYNTLNNRHFQPDAFHSYSPRLEILPNPYEEFRFFASATVKY